MHLASDQDLSSFVKLLVESELPLTYSCQEMLNHPKAGRSLRNYMVLTDLPHVVSGLSADELFWSRYYWYARFVREWLNAARYDAGLEQSLFKLLESGVEHGVASIDSLPQINAAVERDAGV